MTVNGHPKNQQTFSRVSGYVEQASYPVKSESIGCILQFQVFAFVVLGSHLCFCRLEVLCMNACKSTCIAVVYVCMNSRGIKMWRRWGEGEVCV